MKKMGKKKKKRKQKQDNTNSIFAILAAALSNSNNNYSEFIIKKCLNRLRLSLLSQSQPTLPIPILSLLPVLLNSKCSGGIAGLSAEIVGAASLLSLETNEKIAADAEIVRGLVSLLRNSEKRVLVAAANAVLDLSTTSVGRQKLLESSALEALLLIFRQVHRSSTLVSLCAGENGNEASLCIACKEDEFLVLLLDAAIVLINSCDIEQLLRIPRKLYESLLVFLKELWIKVQDQLLSGNIMRSNREKHFCSSKITVNSLAESIFRLSLNADQFTIISKERVERSIFSSNEGSFENFIVNYWEASPFLVRSTDSLIEGNDIFTSFVQDELDILSFLNDVRHKLGCPLVHEQDIRVLKTDKISKKEVHFFPRISDSFDVKDPYLIYADDISKCEEAYKEGYTIALRGMEFRFECLANIADGLASLFGQPSVGANMYLTPPNSQGLACHYDDHCVFVCQLFGTKHWKIFAQPSVQLPRLYHPCDIVNGVEAESSTAECRQFLLREGDILYIPRGFPHKACTEDDGLTGSAEFSLHLTLGVEVERPFEWEGFAHVALCCWNQAQKIHHHASVESFSGILNLMSVNLLHLLIGLLGHSDPTFRKACLVGAVSRPSDTEDWFYLNQKTIFDELIGKISADSRFLELLSSMEMAIRENTDPFQQMRWLQLLDWNRETLEGHDRNLPFTGAEIMFPLYAEHKDMAETAFMQVKSKFCSEVSFEDVIERYKMLLGKYKETRKQYINGMLSLHCN
ncbi:hypothetical protein AB3S75_020739 [Citrus x aurantiifolia]